MAGAVPGMDTAGADTLTIAMVMDTVILILVMAGDTIHTTAIGDTPITDTMVVILTTHIREAAMPADLWDLRFVHKTGIISTDV